jgi:hypothetical protein
MNADRKNKMDRINTINKINKFRSKYSPPARGEVAHSAGVVGANRQARQQNQEQWNRRKERMVIAVGARRSKTLI